MGPACLIARILAGASPDPGDVMTCPAIGPARPRPGSSRRTRWSGGRAAESFAARVCRPRGLGRLADEFGSVTPDVSPVASDSCWRRPRRAALIPPVVVARSDVLAPAHPGQRDPAPDRGQVGGEEPLDEHRGHSLL